VLGTLLAGCTSILPNAQGGPADEGDENTAPGGASAAPTCETIIPASLVDQFTELGWTPHVEPFRIGPNEVSGGITCTWGDFEMGANDIVQMYGWAPLEAEQSAEMQDYLASEGWKVEQEGSVTYITESMPSAEWSDEDGYGMTYAFGDGWASLADTKSGLDVITWRG
jgi:hypothetical protein